MEHYIPMVTIVGAALLAMAWMPYLTRKFRISYSIVYVLLGILLYSVLDFLPEADPVEYTGVSVRLTEMMVIISLMGTGLKIDEPFSFRNWRIPIRLVSITMLLSIAAVCAIGLYFLNLELPSALLLAAVLAPTDPVLADDVQVGPPMEKERSDVRFSLTAEAGLNDGMAFPFTWLAITFALIRADEGTMWHWFGFDFLYRIAAGAVIGIVVGRVVGYLIFSLKSKDFLTARDGFIAFSLTLLVYGVTELVKGYGFVSVFVCAVALRSYAREHKFHESLHSFTDQIERMLMAVVLILFGGILVHEVFSTFSWQYIGFALVVVLVVRPVTAYIAVSGSPLHWKEKSAISFFGIKGIGSLFYLAFGISHANFQNADELWALASWVILGSLLIHGLSAPFVMRHIEKQFPKWRGKKA